MARLSVVISAYNEEERIEACLSSVSWADEIIFIDSSSTDSTPQIAKRFTKNFFTQPNRGMLNTNKNVGFTKATGDWIFSLDGDERVPEELRKEIEHIISSEEKEYSGYYIPRKNIIFGKWIKHSGWYPDYQLRLFKRGLGKFNEEHVHEMISLDGKAGYCKAAMIHENYQTIFQFVQKLNLIYAQNEAEELLKKGYTFSYIDAIRFPMKEFLSRFFARGGYKDGFHGLMLALLQACYHYIVFAKIWESKGFPDNEKMDTLTIVNREIEKQGKDIQYWYITDKMKRAKSQLELFVLQIRRKLL